MQKRRWLLSLSRKGKEHYTKKRLFLLFFLFLLLGTLSVSAEKRIYLNLQNEPMGKALDKVANAAGMKINFHTEDVKGYQITLKIQGATIGYALEQIIADKPFQFNIRNEFITITRTRARVATDKRTLTGEVIDSEARPLLGAFIFVADEKGQQVDVLSTDVDGRYTLKLAFGRTYSVKARFLGTKEKTINVKPDVIELPMIVLEDDNTLIGEVVVTGYGNILKGNYTGSATTLKASEIMTPGLSSIDQMLQGVVPGMLVSNTTGQVGASSKIRVRGTSTLLGSQEPVWVVDGVVQRDPQPFNSDSNMNFSVDGDDIRQLAGNAISWLNPNDIETITVLKDASATAIYGSKAANGVIVIKTKKANEQRVSVNYNGSVSIGQRPSYGMYDRMNSAQNMQLSKDIYDEHRKYTTQILPIGYAGLVQRLTNKEITLLQMNQEYRRMALQNTDWFDLLFRNSISHSHSVSISGGSQKVMNRTSFGYNDEKGDARGNDMNSFTGTSNTQINFSPSFRINALLHGSIRNVNGFTYGVSPWDYAFNTSRILPVYDEKNELYYHGKRGVASYPIPNKTVYNYNILNELSNTGSSNSTRTWDATIDLNWKLWTGLEYQGLFSYASSSFDSKAFASERSSYISQIRGYEFGEVMANSTEMKSSPLPFGGLLDTDLINNSSITARNCLVYDRQLKEKHRVTFQLGTEMNSVKMKGGTNRRYGYLPDRGETFTLPPATYLNGTRAMDNKVIAQGNSTVINRVENELSGYGLAVYTYNDRYVVNINARIDASNRFAQEKNGTFEPTWSAGFKWRAGNEKFAKALTWLNNFDLYGSYGFQGNAVVSVSPYLIATDGGLNNLYNAYVLNVKNLPYPNLGWEKTKTFNIGVDASLLNGRLNFVFNYYNKVSSVLASRNLPIENGVTNGIVSGTQMRNYGYDFVVDIIPISTKNVTWQVSLNTSVAKNSVRKNERINTINDYLNGMGVVEGRPFSTFYSYEFDKLDQQDGKPLFKNLDIKKGENALDFLVESGKYTPDFSGGINTMLKYKRISFYALFAVQWGGSARLPELYPGASVSVNGLPMPETNASTKLIGRWRKPGDNTNIPSLPGLGNELITLPSTATETPTKASLYELYNYSNLQVAKTDFIRCRSVSLTYELNETWLKRFSVRRMLVKASMTNPFVVALDKKWDGLDPETGNWPARRVTSLSLQVMF